MLDKENDEIWNSVQQSYQNESIKIPDSEAIWQTITSNKPAANAKTKSNNNYIKLISKNLYIVFGVAITIALLTHTINQKNIKTNKITSANSSINKPSIKTPNYASGKQILKNKRSIIGFKEITNRSNPKSELIKNKHIVLNKINLNTINSESNPGSTYNESISTDEVKSDYRIYILNTKHNPFSNFKSGKLFNFHDISLAQTGINIRYISKIKPTNDFNFSIFPQVAFNTSKVGNTIELGGKLELTKKCLITSIEMNYQFGNFASYEIEKNNTWSDTFMHHYVSSEKAKTTHWHMLKPSIKIGYTISPQIRVYAGAGVNFGISAKSIYTKTLIDSGIIWQPNINVIENKTKINNIKLNNIYNYHYTIGVLGQIKAHQLFFECNLFSNPTGIMSQKIKSQLISDSPNSMQNKSPKFNLSLGYAFKLGG